MDTAHSQRTKSTINKIPMQDEKLSLRWNVKTVEFPLTYCISIQSGGTCEDPEQTHIGLTRSATNVLNVQCVAVFTCPQPRPHSESWSLQQTPGCEQFVSCLDFQPH